MTIAYTYGNGLYVNLTNRCTNSCDFCVRQQGAGIYGSDSLWLEREPTRKEALDAILAMHPEHFDELVFCGYGEPTCRLDDLLWIAKEIKKRFTLPIRVNTNGHASLIYGKDTGPMFRGAVDTEILMGIGKGFQTLTGLQQHILCLNISVHPQLQILCKGLQIGVNGCDFLDHKINPFLFTALLSAIHSG